MVPTNCTSPAATCQASTSHHASTLPSYCATPRRAVLLRAFDRRPGAATCNFPCAGDAAQTCGGYNAISVYEYLDYPFVGCFKDSSDRVLSGAAKLDDPAMTTEVCEVPPAALRESAAALFFLLKHFLFGPKALQLQLTGTPFWVSSGLGTISVHYSTFA